MPKETLYQRSFKFLFRYFIFPLVTPLVCILFTPFYRIYDGLKFEWFQQRRVSTPVEHMRKVARVQEQVRKWAANGRKTRMCTAKPLWNSWSVHGINKRSLAQIDVNELTAVVEVDETNRVVTVEPGMMMGQLTSILIPRGWTIPVVPEFETLTVGGVICGTGIESNSIRCGLSSDTSLEYEVVLSNGKVVNCSKDENSDLFHAIPWSHGTLGFLTAVKIPLIPAEKYVQLEYHPTDSLAEAQRLLRSEDHEFVEGIAYGRQKFVVTLGNMVDKADPTRGRLNHINRWYKPFWYKHMESFLQKRPRKQGKAYVEYIPLRDYYHRHTRSYFWEIPSAVPLSNNSLWRLLFGYILPVDSKLGRRIGALFGSAGEGGYNMFYVLNHVLQDFIVPIKQLEPILDLVHETVEVYPLWLCPCKFFRKPGMVHCNDSETELYIDIGVYGTTPKKAEFHPEDTIRKLEAFCLQHGGVQFMYADSFLSREEFRRMFDMTLYDQVRVKYECMDAFPDVYDKVGKAAKQIQV